MPTSPDRLFAASVRINGSENEELYRCARSITVNEDLDQGSSFEIVLNLCRNEDGSWPHLEDENLRPWNRVTIAAAFPDHRDTIMDGYISRIVPRTDQQAGSVTLTISGVDGSYIMNLEERTRVWQDRTYEQIAREIVEDGYQLHAVLPDSTGGGDDTPPPPVTQRSPDLRFLRELARRKGYEFYVQGADAHFHPPVLTGTPQKLVTVNFGEETNCDRLEVEVDGTRPTEATITRLDPVTGETQTATASATDLDPMGASDPGEMRGYGVPPTRVVARRQTALSEAQMAEYVQGLLRRHGWWVRARGTLNGLRYGRVLRSKRTVTIKGLGQTYNGVYYVRSVTHRLTPRTYQMDFVATRNRLGQQGTEDFTGERPDATSVPAAGAGADAEAVAVREDGAQVAPA